MNILPSLTERRETAQDLRINVTKGYEACTDKVFKKYIGDFISRDEDDNARYLTAQALMVRASNNYKNMVQNGKLNTPD